MKYRKYRDKDYRNYVNKKVVNTEIMNKKLEAETLSESKILVRREIKLIIYDPIFGERLI